MAQRSTRLIKIFEECLVTIYLYDHEKNLSARQLDKPVFNIIHIGTFHIRYNASLSFAFCLDILSFKGLGAGCIEAAKT